MMKNEPCQSYNDALYDMFDIKHVAVVTLEVFSTVMKIAYCCDAEVTDATFHQTDANKNGKIECKELTDYELNYWFSLNVEASNGFCGANYEK